MKLISVFYHINLTDGTNKAILSESEASELLEYLTDPNCLFNFDKVREDGTIVRAYEGACDVLCVKVGETVLRYPVWDPFIYALEHALEELEGLGSCFEEVKC